MTNYLLVNLLFWAALTIYFVNIVFFTIGIKTFFSKPNGKIELGMHLITVVSASIVLIDIAYFILIYINDYKSIQQLELSFNLILPVSMVYIAGITIKVFAIILGILSIFLYFYARKQHQLRPSLAYSKDLPVVLIASGPYKYIRHPFYTSYLLNWIIPFLLTGNFILLIPVFAIFYLYNRSARLEENKFNLSDLQSEYAAYIKKTGKYFPTSFRFIKYQSDYSSYIKKI